MTESSTFIDGMYNAVALTGVAIIIYVMQKVELDRVGRIDPYPVHQFRRLAFTGTALALCYSVISSEWQRTLPVLLIVSAGVFNLAVNAVSLHLRNPPPGGRTSRTSASYIAKLIRYFSVHR